MTGRRFRVVFLLAMAFSIAAVAVRYYTKIEKPSRLGDQTRTAFLRWRPQIQALESQTDIYTAFRYPNPPIMALILAPLVALPPVAGAMIWFLLKVGMAGLMCVWAFRLIAAPLPDWAKAIAVLLALHPILGDLAHGNVNLFVGLLVFACLELFRRRCDSAAGLVLALAIACKVTPALFLPYFAWKRAWRLLLASALGLVLWLAVVPGIVLGWDYNQTLLTSWYEQMVKPFVIDGQVTSEHPNQSLPGLAFRLLTREPSFLAYDEGDGHVVAADFHTLVDLGTPTVKVLVKVAGVAFLGVMVWLCRVPTWKAGGPRSGPLLAAELGLILLGMLLLSERTWKHHAVTLVLPTAVLMWGATRHPTPYVRRTLRAILLLFTTLTIVPSLLDGPAQDLAMVYGSYTAAYLLQAAGLWVLLRQRPDAIYPGPPT